MARLAAYYQEDFHYAPVGYGSKQRKAAYVVYDEPRNNLFNSGYIDSGPRIRALASSEPSLSPIYNYTPKTSIKTLRGISNRYSNQAIEQPHLAIQQLEDPCEYLEPMNPYDQLQLDACDCESVYSYRENPAYDNSAYIRYKPTYDSSTYVKHKSKSKDKICKRLSYDDHSSDMYIAMDEGRSNFFQSFDTDHRESLPPKKNPVHYPEVIFNPPVSFRSDSSHGRWQQWPWNMVDTHASPALLSPPSPLDSGLSSQSITSSPSLEAEPVPVHNGHLQIAEIDGHHICSCSQRLYPEHGYIMSSPGRYDSGRSSPGPYAINPKRKASVRTKSGRHVNGNIVYVEDDFDDIYSHGQIRYGMLGLVGETVQHNVPYIANGRHCERSDHVENNKAPVPHYVESGVSLNKNESHSSKSSKTKPTQSAAVINEASEKSSSSSSDHIASDKSPEPESSLGTDASNSPSNSSSVNSSHNELQNGDRRKSNKTTEKQIRELEDMYKKCNLGDYDLLERAERRDLPTAHQIKKEKSGSTLTRSKSDTFYEMFGPIYRGNPYEIHQRAPPLRRSGIPDIISDDMALRKHCKPVTTSSFNPVDNTVTYMLCSSHFTPTIHSGRDILYEDNPDIEYDDFSYRKHYFGKKNKILDPQPPFGIPLRPPPPQSVYNDYLHVVPIDGPKPLCHPRGNPDVVRDDMAYRTLRKDDPELLYYDAVDAYRKKRG